MKIENIYKVAEDHFFAKNYSDVKLDNIANALDIRKPSLYYYFEDKKSLFLHTLKYSMNNYIQDFKEIINKQDIEKFLEWYLVYPSEKRNLFAVSFQKWHCVDKEVNSSIYSWKVLVDRMMDEFISEFCSNQVRKYLLINLLDKLAKDNCVDWYCLKYNIKDILPEIKRFLD